MQLTRAARIAGHDNRFVVGASADLGDARFTRFIQPARFTDDRGTVGTGDYALDTDADTRTRHYGIFASNTFEPDEYWAITASVRYNVTHISIADRTGSSPDLDGSHRYSHASPALGVTFNPLPAFTAYASYTESVRMPTAVELTCADPTSPCRLPNAFLTDPDLNPVIARTGEVGARGHIGAATTWSAAIYRTELDDDIQFVSSGGIGTLGYFRNVGRTRREGVELAAGTRWGTWSADARFAYVGATFRAPFTESSAANSTANGNGEIEVRPGNRMPGIPQRSFKLRLARDSGVWAMGATLIANSSTYARGDENNSDARGRVPGYAVANFDAHWNVDSSLQVFARIDNAFDTRYSNFGVLGFNSFTGPNRTFDPANAVAEPFYGPGAPRGAWVGLRYAWR